MKNYQDGLYMVPPHMHHAIINYMEYGWDPGGFLSSVISGDLFGAYCAGDETNLEAMREWVMYFYNYAPAICFGNSDKFNSWMQQGGLSFYDNL